MRPTQYLFNREALKSKREHSIMREQSQCPQRHRPEVKRYKKEAAALRDIMTHFAVAEQLVSGRWKVHALESAKRQSLTTSKQ